MASYDEQAAALVPFGRSGHRERAGERRGGHRRAASYNHAFAELARVTDTSHTLAPEEMFETFFDVIASALGLETAVIIENVDGQPRSMVWRRPQFEWRDRDVAENRALSKLAAQLAPDLVENPQGSDTDGHVTVLPLAPPLFGILRCKTVQPLDRPHRSLLECAIARLSGALYGSQSAP